MSTLRMFCGAALLWSAISVTAHAQDAPGWLIKLGVHDVAPKSDNGTLAGGALAVDVDDSVRPTATFEYLFTPHLGVEAIVAWPFQHKVELNGAQAAKVEQLPPTVSLHYHFNPGGTVSPFVGVGVNYTRFFDIQEEGPLEGANLDLDSSWGVAAHAGLDFRIDAHWLAGVDVRWIDIDTKAKVNGADVGTVNIDPWVYGAYVGYRF